MVAKVRYAEREKKMARQYKMQMKRAMHERRTSGKLSSHSTLYTGSPDSVYVAKLVASFQYVPEKREEILKKYENIKSLTSVR